jgi:phosphoglucosamine mutase
VWEEVRRVESELGDQGRVLVRASGTEALIRVMVEASSEEAARRYADRLSNVTETSMRKE